MRARRLDCKAQNIALPATESSACTTSTACTESFTSAINQCANSRNTPCFKSRSKSASHSRLRQLALSLLCLGLISQKNLADTIEKNELAKGTSSPLLGMVETLACAVSEENAQLALNRLKENRVEAWSLPNEWHGQTTEPALYAGSFDILLLELLKIPEKFPATQSNVEELLLSWNYCLIQSNEGFFNLGTTRPVNSQTVGRTLAHPESPGNWLGFGQLGFPTPANGLYPNVQPPERYVPEGLTTESQTPLFKQKRFWSLYTTQCFPHPDTGAFYYRSRPFGPTRINTVDSKSLAASAEAYPFNWQPSCEAAVAGPVQAAADSDISTATRDATPTLAAALNNQETGHNTQPAPAQKSGDEQAVADNNNDNNNPENTLASNDDTQAGNANQVNDLTAAALGSATNNAETATVEKTNTNTSTNAGWAKILDKPDAEILKIGKLKRLNQYKIKWLSTLQTAATERARNSVASPRLSNTITDERVARVLDSNRESSRIQEFESKRRLSRMRSLRVQLSRQTAATGKLPGTVPAQTPVEAYGKTHSDKVLFDILSKKRTQKTRSERVRLSRTLKLAEQELASNTSSAGDEKENTTQPHRTIVFNLGSYTDSRRVIEVVDSFYSNKPIELLVTGAYLGPSLASEGLKRLQKSKVRRVQSSRVFANIEPDNLKSTASSGFATVISETSKRLQPVKAARVRLSRKFAIAETATMPQHYAVSGTSTPPEHEIKAATTGERRRTFGEIYRNLMARAREPHRRITCLLYTSPSPRDATLTRMPSSA